MILTRTKHQNSPSLKTNGNHWEHILRIRMKMKKKPNKDDFVQICFWEKELHERPSLSKFRQPKPWPAQKNPIPPFVELVKPEPVRVPEVAGKIRKEDWEKVVKMAER